MVQDGEQPTEYNAHMQKLLKLGLLKRSANQFGLLYEIQWCRIKGGKELTAGGAEE
jgi:hypothetical protein